MAGEPGEQHLHASRPGHHHLILRIIEQRDLRRPILRPAKRGTGFIGRLHKFASRSLAWTRVPDRFDLHYDYPCGYC